jgi:hypothetical protein
MKSQPLPRHAGAGGTANLGAVAHLGTGGHGWTGVMRNSSQPGFVCPHALAS